MRGLDADRLRRAPWKLRYEVLAAAASEARKLGVLATHRHATVRFGDGVYLGPGFALRMLERGTFEVGPAVEIRRGLVCEIGGAGRLSIGARCVFTGISMIQCSTTVDIGDDAIVGQGVLIADGSHRFRDPGLAFAEQGYDFRPLVIGAGAVVHTNCTVTNSVGARAVIGAGSVVTRAVPPYCLAFGAPAKVVEYFGPPELREAYLGAG